ncbi:MAG TPA: hypothetical protein VEM13_11645 [Gemmatimonadales bacterium]|nr:hypothetical protein [Gemmatimonadales bacterium]
MMHLPRAAALAAILLTPLLASAPAQPSTYTYRGTIHAVQPRASSLELITGVGFALRLVQMRAVAATRIEKAGVAISLADLKPGDVVRADCRRTGTGLVADRIEALDGAAAPAPPTPR